MRRREFIAALGSATAAWPFRARAQQQLSPLIGYFSTLSEDADRPDAEAYRSGLAERGYVAGRNVEILYRYRDREWEPAHVAAAAEELVRRRVAVIYIPGGPSLVRAVQEATRTIPIVFVNGTDPIESGLVASLNRPGGNVTGVYFRAQELIAKRLELLHELVPAATRIGFLHSGAATLKEAEAAARILGVALTPSQANNSADIETALAPFLEQRIGALAVSHESPSWVQAPKIMAWAADHRIPVIYHSRDIVEAGGLMSCGTSVADACRIAGTYTGRILNGEKPADLPVQQSTRFEIALNLKTAKALGLEVPTKTLVRADVVIE